MLLCFSHFESLAVAVLSECYNKDKRMAHMLLVRELDSWGKTTLFSLADAGMLMDFMEHTSCQTKLNMIWKGCMAQYTPSWKVSTLCDGRSENFPKEGQHFPEGRSALS